MSKLVLKPYSLNWTYGMLAGSVNSTWEGTSISKSVFQPPNSDLSQGILAKFQKMVLSTPGRAPLSRDSSSFSEWCFQHRGGHQYPKSSLREE